ncbi:MAG: hypothetical protein HYT11_04025 [Candidatus Levybacteria bacterium]|nr:hypothetical protein [Candidatus Levybacteria bacterium]
MSSSRYVTKQISEVAPTDSRVSIIGNVVKTDENSFVLDDGTGKIEVTSDIQVEMNKLIRIFCSVVDEKLKADIIQDVNELDLNLFKKVKELYNKAGV